MKIKVAFTLAALAGALLAVSPASATPLGAAGQSVKADVVSAGLVEQVGHRHRRWHRNYAYRHHYRPRYYAYYRPRYYSYQPYYYQPYYSSYYRPYYSPYYYGGYGGYYGGYRRHGGGFSIRFGY